MVRELFKLLRVSVHVDVWTVYSRGRNGVFVQLIQQFVQATCSAHEIPSAGAERGQLWRYTGLLETFVYM